MSKPPVISAGASGFSFKEWKGDFYPAKTRQEDMLPYYSSRLPTVEINSTYYAMPKPVTLKTWSTRTPDEFRFAIKSPKQITHDARLSADKVAATTTLLFETLEVLGDKRGPVLFQLPPSMKMDLPRLTEFLQLLPQNHRAAFEFRHDSWFCDELYSTLKEAGASLCLSEREDSTPPPLVETASWGYVRLRLESYSEADLGRWAERLQATKWKTISVFFMHEPTAPAYAETLMRLASA